MSPRVCAVVPYRSSDGSDAAEHVTAVTVAMKDKLTLSLGVAVGSSIVRVFFLPYPSSSDRNETDVALEPVANCPVRDTVSTRPPPAISDGNLTFTG